MTSKPKSHMQPPPPTTKELVSQYKHQSGGRQTRLVVDSTSGSFAVWAPRDSSGIPAGQRLLHADKPVSTPPKKKKREDTPAVQGKKERERKAAEDKREAKRRAEMGFRPSKETLQLPPRTNLYVTAAAMPMSDSLKRSIANMFREPEQKAEDRDMSTEAPPPPQPRVPSLEPNLRKALGSSYHKNENQEPVTERSSVFGGSSYNDDIDELDECESGRCGICTRCLVSSS